MTMVPQVIRLISQGADNTVAMSFESLRHCYDGGDLTILIFDNAPFSVIMMFMVILGASKAQYYISLYLGWEI